MAAKILNGKKLSESILLSLKKEIKKSNLKLRLAVIQVGKNPASQVFIKQKRKACEKIGLDFKLFQFPITIGKLALKKEIEQIVRDRNNSGIVIQLPLSNKFQPVDDFLNLIPEEKDVDVLSEKSLGKFYQGNSKILPPVVQGILHFLKKYKLSLEGKNVVIIGTGKLVGLPLTIQLLREKATLSVLNEFSKNITIFTKKADVLITGAGKANLIRGNMVKKGVIVIDAGTSIETGELTGDIDFQSVSKKASYITPVPGGVGPMTVACLLANLVRLNNCP